MMMKPSLVAILAPILLGACASAPLLPAGTPQPTPSGAPSALPSVPLPSLEGKVLDEHGLPISGAKVEAFADAVSLGFVETGADGAFRLMLATPGPLRAVVTKVGYTPRERRAVSLVGQPVRLDFGAVSSDGVERNFISDKLEVTKVTMTEEMPGKGLVFTLDFSLPLSEQGQADALSRLELLNPDEKVILRPGVVARDELATTTSWENNGQRLTFRSKGPILASAPAAARTYSLRFRQARKDTRDPETLEYQYEDLGIRAVNGAVLGTGRADYAFFAAPAEGLFPWTLLSDKAIGANPQVALWRLTHQRAVAVVPGSDKTAPAITGLSLRQGALLNGVQQDILQVTFNEPLFVAKSEDEYRYTRLDFDKRLFRLKTSKTTLDASVEVNSQPSVRPDPYDARVLNLDYPGGTFEDKRWFELILTSDFLDPVGNSPSPSADRMSLEIKR